MPLSPTEVRQRLAGRTIWLWHYMHSDWQWEQSRHWHEERYALAVREALDIMAADEEFCYFFDTASEFFSAVAQRLGTRLEELQERVREGRVRVVSGQVANCRPTQTGDETYIRNIQLGREYFETHLPPTDLSLFHSVDIAIGGVQMPQLLSQAGFDFYRAWRPHGPMNVLGIPHQFVWQGIDSSRILVTRGSYGGWQGESPDIQKDADWGTVVTYVYNTFFHDQLLLKRSPTDHLWMIQGADDSRPLRNWLGDRPNQVQSFVAAWRDREAPPIRWCTPLEFSQAVAGQADRLPVVEGVLDAADCAYNMVNHGANGLWVWRQMNDRRLLAAEWWAAVAGTAGFEAPTEELQRLWYQHCTYQAHAQDAAFADDWWALVDRARAVKFQAERIQSNALSAIVSAAGGGERTTRYLFNPHPWPVEADVEIYHPCVTAGIHSLCAVDEDGQPFPQQQLREFRHPRFDGSINDEERLVRLQLPPMGYRRIELMESADPGPERPMPPKDGVVATSALRLVFRDHALREVRDLASGRNYNSREGDPWPGLRFHVLDHQNWLFEGPEVRRERFQPNSSQWLQAGPFRWHHRSVGTLGPYQARLDTVVDDRTREVQVAVRLEGHWETPPNTGFVTLLAEVEAGGRMAVDEPFAVAPRDPDGDLYHDDVRGDRDLGIDSMMERLRPGVFWARSWTDWSGDGQGLTLISVDGGYYWLKESGQFGHILLRCAELRPSTWEAFCPPSFTGTGTHAFRYTMRFHDGDWRQADPQRRSLELRYPPLAVRADHPADPLLPSSTHSFLHLEGPALLSAYYPTVDGSCVRIYEHTGQGGEVTLTFDRPLSSAQAVDLLGRPADISVRMREQGDRVALAVKPWQIVTLRLGWR